MNEPLLTIDEVCDLLKVKKSYIYRLTSTNQIPYYKVRTMFGSQKEAMSQVSSEKHEWYKRFQRRWRYKFPHLETPPRQMELLK